MDEYALNPSTNELLETLLNIPGAEPGVLRLTVVSIGLSLLALLAAAHLSRLRHRRSGAR